MTDVTVRAISPDQHDQVYPLLGEIDPERWVWMNYVGPLSMYVKAGCEVVERLDGQCIVRRAL